MINIEEIMSILPHRYPFLLVDKIIEFETGKRIVGIKNVTINEPFFQGHFPGKPVMPGVLIIEAMAQVGAVLMLKDMENREDKLALFAGIDEARFRKPVVPGDIVRFEVEVLKVKSVTAKLHGKAFVGDELVCEATVLCAMVKRNG
ncbi:MAG: 3-hydroxyacyl-ACP dehydratase FabZ [Acidobacteriota bacterium]|nr:3-hydroxyacyl-ACP dehydratase FabZ [Thermoanaerobaculaceae bacterium]